MALIDLFCGCGGFSLGAHRAGYDVALAFDIDPILTSSFSHNFPNTKLVLSDVSSLSASDIRSEFGGQIDGVIGGPPCQGFSDMGHRNFEDPRRKLLGHFFRIVAELLPPFFIMENVKGLAYKGAREVLDDALLLIDNDYHVFGPTILDASDFGAATARRRLFVVGIRKTLGQPLTEQDFQPFIRPASTVRQALADLAGAERINDDSSGHERWRVTKRGPPHAYARKLRAVDRVFTGHRVVEHKADVSKRFATVPQGGMDRIGRHPRLAWDGQCPTLRAGTGSDHGSFQAVRPLHPDEHRVITVREAARLQGFPDSHKFHPTIWHSFRMIGNSVSPVMAEAIFKVLKQKFRLAGRPCSP